MFVLSLAGHSWEEGGLLGVDYRTFPSPLSPKLIAVTVVPYSNSNIMTFKPKSSSTVNMKTSMRGKKREKKRGTKANF